jgi:hypothetical protein
MTSQQTGSYAVGLQSFLSPVCSVPVYTDARPGIFQNSTGDCFSRKTSALELLLLFY